MADGEGAVLAGLIGRQVAVLRTDTKDAHYGTLTAADASFIVLTDFVHGWHGQAGWWWHGEGQQIAIGVTVVKSVTPTGRDFAELRSAGARRHHG